MLFPDVKCCFLRVGGPAWELKIDAERLQDKENNDLEEESETIHNKIDTYCKKMVPPNVSNLSTFSFFGFRSLTDKIFILR